MKRAVSLILAGSLALSLAACGSSASSSVAASSAAATTLTGKGNGFGGAITATVTMEGDTITAVSFDGPDETENVGGVALSTLAEQIVAANGTEIDGVSGATYTTNGCKAAVLNAIDPDANPYEEDSAEKTEWPTGAEPVEIPAGSNIVMASTYGLYTKSADSDQDAVIPFSAPATEYSEAVETNYAKYIQIGDIVWTGALGSTAASENAVVYSAVIDGTETTLFDYCATEEGGKWYIDATDGKDCYLLTSDEAAASADADNVASTYTMEYKEGDGHGVDFWSSPITFPGNMQLLKEFAEQTNFSYDYYADGGLTQNADGYWQTADAVSGATIAEGCTYLDMLKTLYDRIQNGEYEPAV